MAGFVAAEDDLAFALGFLFQKERAAAIGAGLGDRLVVGGEPALGVAVAAVEEAPPAPFPLHDLALAAVRAEEPDLPGFLLLDVLAVRIVAASNERPEPAAAPHQGVAALRAVLVDRLLGLHLEL